MSAEYIQGDIHNEILQLNDNVVELIYTSPPFAITEAEWDKPLDWENLFPEMWRVLKPNGIIVLHASMPFTYELLKYEKPKYHYIWKKSQGTNFFKAKLQPIRITEEIFVYYKKPGTYNPQMIGNEWIPKRMLKHTSGQKYFGTRNNIKKSYTHETEGHIGKYPNTFLEYPTRKDGSGITRPDELIDFFIKTYSNEGDNILDMTCCNNYVGDRCKLLNRNYLGIDINLSL